jgi:hypothetical protein
MAAKHFKVKQGASIYGRFNEGDVVTKADIDGIEALGGFDRVFSHGVLEETDEARSVAGEVPVVGDPPAVGAEVSHDHPTHDATGAAREEGKNNDVEATKDATDDARQRAESSKPHKK